MIAKKQGSVLQVHQMGKRTVVLDLALGVTQNPSSVQVRLRARYCNHFFRHFHLFLVALSLVARLKLDRIGARKVTKAPTTECSNKTLSIEVEADDDNSFECRGSSRRE